MPRRSFTAEEKARVLGLAKQVGVKEAGRRLGIRVGAIYRWKSKEPPNLPTTADVVGATGRYAVADHPLSGEEILDRYGTLLSRFEGAILEDPGMLAQIAEAARGAPFRQQRV